MRRIMKTKQLLKNPLYMEIKILKTKNNAKKNTKQNRIRMM